MKYEAGQMAQKIRLHVAIAEDLSSVPRTDVTRSTTTYNSSSR